MKNLNYLMDHILDQILKNMEKRLRIYTKKIENRITFQIKTGYNVELLMPEMMKLLESTKRK